MSKPSAPVRFAFEQIETTTNHDVLGSYPDKCCYWNTERNAEGVFKHLALKRVCGSLVLAGAWAYGSPNKKHNYKKNPSNSHAWLEDAEGNVYDYCVPWWHYEVSQVLDDAETAHLPLGVEFRGASKAHLKSLGMDYIPAPEATQKWLFDWANEAPWMMRMLASVPFVVQPIRKDIIRTI